MKICPICTTEFEGVECPVCKERMLHKSRFLHILSRIMMAVASIAVIICVYFLLSSYFSTKGKFIFTDKNEMRQNYEYTEENTGITSNEAENDISGEEYNENTETPENSENIENDSESNTVPDEADYDRAQNFGIVQFAEINAQDAITYEVPEGLMVLELNEDSPAFRSGLMNGDVIVSADGKRIHYATDLILAIYSCEGDEIVLGVHRSDGSTYDITVKF